MKLLTAAIKKQLPKIGSQENNPDATAYAKFFTPWSNWTWWATEWDGADEFFGLVSGHETELGYFSLKELESINGPFGLKIERDLYFKPTKLSIIRNNGGQS
jgi:hypothetical protein